MSQPPESKPVLGEVFAEVDGNRYGFKLNWYARSQLERAYGGQRTTLQVLAAMLDAETDPLRLSFNDVLQVFWASRLHFSEHETVKATAALLDRIPQGQIGSLLRQIIEQSGFFDPAPDDAMGNAPAPVAPPP